MAFAVFKGDRRVSKAHSTSHAALTEAMEMGIVVRGSDDFFSPGAAVTVSLCDGYEIRQVQDPT